MLENQKQENKKGGRVTYEDLTKEELDLYQSKNCDYAKGGDRYGNFNRVASIKKLYPGLPWDSPIGICLGYMLKQLDAAFWMLAQGYEGKIENVDKRLQDVHVYAKIARLVGRE